MEFVLCVHAIFHVFYTICIPSYVINFLILRYMITQFFYTAFNYMLVYFLVPLSIAFAKTSWKCLFFVLQYFWNLEISRNFMLTQPKLIYQIKGIYLNYRREHFRFNYFNVNYTLRLLYFSNFILRGLFLMVSVTFLQDNVSLCNSSWVVSVSMCTLHV